MVEIIKIGVRRLIFVLAVLPGNAIAQTNSALLSVGIELGVLKTTVLDESMFVGKLSGIASGVVLNFEITNQHSFQVDYSSPTLRSSLTTAEP